MLFHICLAALFAMAASTCEQTPDEATLMGRFCRSQVVFRGNAFSGMSGLSFGADGQETSHLSINFHVTDVLKNSAGPSLDYDLTVARTYVVGSPCDKRVNYGPETLIMGNLTGSTVRVTACDVHPAWGCLSDEFKTTLNEGVCQDNY